MRPVTAATPHQHVDGPDSRPAQAARSLEEPAPEPRDRLGIEARGVDRAGVAKRFSHHLAQAAADPAVEREDESALGTLEQAAVEPAQADAPQSGFLQNGLIARIVGKP